MQRSPQSGFTMLELSIVLLIIALITGLGLAATLGAIEAAKRSATESKMDAIEDALMAFRNKYNRLPCPAQQNLTFANDTFGLEAEPLGNCIGGPPTAYEHETSNDTVRGAVPVKVLGLPNEFAYDGWDRQFIYVVDSNATYLDAFDVIKPDEFCELEVNDKDGNPMTGNVYHDFGAVYGLMSAGPNGHGAYTRSGTRYSSGSTNANEQLNCRCGANGLAVFGDDNAIVAQPETTTFDDIVRYKERWQMQNEKDEKFANYYGGPDMAISLDNNGINNIKTFNIECGQFITYPGGQPPTINSTDPTTGLEFTKNNEYLFAYNSGNCYLYKINDASVTLDTTQACPAYVSGPDTAVSMSENGFLAITQSASPYVKIWKLNGNVFDEFTHTASTPVLETALPSRPLGVKFSKDGTYLLAWRHTGSTYVRVYRKNGLRSYEKMTDPPSNPTYTLYGDVSADERMLAVGLNNTETLRVWTIDPSVNPFGGPTNPFTYLGEHTEAVEYPRALSFSPDGKYIVFATGTPSPTTLSSRIKIYKIDGTAVTYTPPTGSLTHGGNIYTDAQFSSDSRFLALPYVDFSGLDRRAIILRRTDEDTFVWHRTLTFGLNASEQALRLRFAR